MKLTDAQQKALDAARTRYARIGEWFPMIGGQGAIVVQCFYESGGSIWLAIEPDGYTHS